MEKIHIRYKHPLTATLLTITGYFLSNLNRPAVSWNDELLIALDAKYVDCVVVAAAQHQVAQDPDNTGTR
jgi:hypothetical protein